MNLPKWFLGLIGMLVLIAVYLAGVATTMAFSPRVAMASPYTIGPGMMQQYGFAPNMPFNNRTMPGFNQRGDQRVAPNTGRGTQRVMPNTGRGNSQRGFSGGVMPRTNRLAPNQIAPRNFGVSGFSAFRSGFGLIGLAVRGIFTLGIGALVVLGIIWLVQRFRKPTPPVTSAS
jgi:hypothetical protein